MADFPCPSCLWRRNRWWRSMELSFAEYDVAVWARLMSIFRDHFPSWSMTNYWCRPEMHVSKNKVIPRAVKVYLRCTSSYPRGARIFLTFYYHAALHSFTKGEQLVQVLRPTQIESRFKADCNPALETERDIILMTFCTTLRTFSLFLRLFNRVPRSPC